MHRRTRGNVRATKLALALALALSPLASHALGLGNIKVHSALNEPLNAEIALTSVTDKELKGLNVSLPSRAEFEAAGVERLPYQSQIQFTVAKRADGHYVLQLRTDNPIEEPFLHLLLQVEWSGGKLIREYSALIDPPYQVAGKPVGVEPPTPAEPAPEAPAAVPAESSAVAPPPTEEQVRAEMQNENAKAAQPAPAEANAAPAEASAPAESAAAAPVAPEQATAPVAEAPAQAPAAEPVQPQGAGETAAAEAAPTPEPAHEATAPAVATAAPAEWSRVAEYHVRRGDTLWEISSKVRGDSQLSIEQVVLALYRTNPDAFFGNNVNNLKAGKILRVPERGEVESIGATQAHKEFRAQYDVWQEYKLKLASAGRTVKVASEPEAEAPAAKGEVAATPGAAPATEGQPSAKAEAPRSEMAPAAPAKGGQPEELLKIVRSNLQAQKATPAKPAAAETEAAKDTGGTEREALAERVSTLEESLLSRQMEQKEIGEKIGQVRELLKNESRLIEIERKEPAAAPKPAPELKPIETAKVEAPKPAEPAKSEATEAPKPVPPAAAPAAPKPAPAHRKHPVIPPPPPQERGFLSEVMDDLGGVLLPIIVGVFVIVAGAIALIYMRRRSKSIAEFEESILSSEAISSETPSVSEPATTGAQAASSGDTSFLSDFSQGGMGNLHTDEVDPIAEAEVYLAYGRDETAEEILKEAIVKNPQREELKVKLLEIYHQRNDVKAFETLAEEYYAQLGGRPSKLWSKVEEMGRKLNPDNPMFRGGAPVKSSAPAFSATQPGLRASATVAEAHSPAASGSSQSVDFDLASPAAPGAEAAPSGLDLDLTQTGNEINFEDTLKTSAQPAAETGFDSLDFGKPAENIVEFDSGTEAAPAADADAGLDWGIEKPEAATPAGGAEEVALAEPEAGAPGEEAVPSQWDETATKLDLAKAYIDMGDSEGARSILNEVMSEGNDTQKRQAQELVAQIG
jgi:pilus assembly protein FimV